MKSELNRGRMNLVDLSPASCSSWSSAPSDIGSFATKIAPNIARKSAVNVSLIAHMLWRLKIDVYNESNGLSAAL